jgi:hypothetical protein
MVDEQDGIGLGVPAVDLEGSDVGGIIDGGVLVSFDGLPVFPPEDQELDFNLDLMPRGLLLMPGRVDLPHPGSSGKSVQTIPPENAIGVPPTGPHTLAGPLVAGFKPVVDAIEPVCNLLTMRIDHLVWYSADLAEGEQTFARLTDCQPAYGGIHPGEGTRNALLSLCDNTYLEILGRDPAQPETSLDPEIRALTGSGLYHWAAGGVDLEELRGRAIACGLDASNIVTGGRTLPNGNRLGWKLLGIRNHGLGALVPFFIDWMDSEHPARAAPRGGSLVRLDVFTPEPEKLTEIYRVLRLDITVTRAVVPAFSATVESRSGRHILRMFDPIPRGYVI